MTFSSYYVLAQIGTLDFVCLDGDQNCRSDEITNFYKTYASILASPSAWLFPYVLLSYWSSIDVRSKVYESYSTKKKFKKKMGDP